MDKPTDKNILHIEQNKKQISTSGNKTLISEEKNINKSFNMYCQAQKEVTQIFVT